ncbi:hypothetical protein GCM10027597_64160 [Saccharopolyspora tripterygii]
MGASLFWAMEIQLLPGAPKHFGVVWREFYPHLVRGCPRWERSTIRYFAGRGAVLGHTRHSRILP